MSVRLAKCVSIFVICLLICINCSLVYIAVPAESIAEATEPIPKSSNKNWRFRFLLFFVLVTGVGIYVFIHKGIVCLSFSSFIMPAAQ